MSALKVAVLFAGCGGSALGHRLAGDRVLFVCEWKRMRLDALALNFPDAQQSGDVRELTGEEILDRVGQVDVIDASPPCQDFSRANRRRDMNGDDAWLLHEVPRIVAAARPRAVAIENVPGLLDGEPRALHFDPLVDELAEAGYRVAARVLDSSMLRVPQRRERLLVVGLREDVLADPASAFPRYNGRRTAMRDAIPGAVAIVRLPRECDKPPNLVYREPLRWHASRPAPTILTGGFSGGAMTTALRHARIEMEDGTVRPLTIEDGKALMGFPPDYRFPDGLSLGARWAMLGDAVPPPMARAWARSIGTAIRRGA